jgi:hypothetical protein
VKARTFAYSIRGSRLSRAWHGTYHPLFIVLAAILLGGTASVLIAKTAGFDHIVDELRGPDLVWLIVCIAGEALAYLGYILAYREMARVEGGPTLGFRHAGRIVSAGFAPFFAAKAAGGFALDYKALRSAGLSKREGMARVLGLNALEYVVLAPAACAAAIYILFSGDHEAPRAVTLPWLLVIPGIAFGAWISNPRRSERLKDGHRHGRLRAAVAHGVSGIVVVRQLLTQPFKHGFGFLGTCCYWFGDILCLWAGLRVFHAAPALPALIVAYASGYAVTRRSFPAGGPGAVEAMLTFALVWVHVPLAPALLGVMTYRLFNFWLAFVPAITVLPVVRELDREVAETKRAA